MGLEVTPTLGISALSAQGQSLPLVDPFGVSLAFDATVPFTGPLHDRIRIGFGGYLPPSGALHLIAHASDQPFIPYYDNRTQRLVLIPAIAVRILDGLGVGAGVNVLGGVSGPATVNAGASGAPEPRLALTAATSVAVHVGVRFDPRPGVHLALTFRQRFSAPAVVDSAAEIAGAPLAISVATHSALFDPTTVVAAASFDLGRATVELDASYALWSAYEGPWVSVQATLPGVNVLSSLPASVARDVVSLRAAGTYRIDAGARSSVMLRAGGGFEPSMLDGAQQGVTNLVDGDKLLGGLGATLALRGVGPATLRFGAGASVHGCPPQRAGEARVHGGAVPARHGGGADGDPPRAGDHQPGLPAALGGRGVRRDVAGDRGGAVKARFACAALLLRALARARRRGRPLRLRRPERRPRAGRGRGRRRSRRRRPRERRARRRARSARADRLRLRRPRRSR